MTATEDAVAAPLAAAGASAKVAGTLTSTVEAAVPGSFCADLWQSVAGPGGIFRATMEHPFLAGLADGSLEEASFRYYIAQDSLYLKEYSRALALVASRARRPEWTTFFCRCANEAAEAEGGFHQEFLSYFGSTVEVETAGAVPSPNNTLYTSFILATVHGKAFYEGLAAVLSCFIVYLEVGKALKQGGSPHPLHQQWIDKYGGQEFEGIVMQMVHLVNEVAADLGQAQRERMRDLFQAGCRMEYMFWDGAHSRQHWPV